MIICIKIRNKIYFQETNESSLPGAVFLLSGAISLVSLTLSCYVMFSLKGKRMSEVTVTPLGLAEAQQERNDLDKSKPVDIGNIITFM